MKDMLTKLVTTKTGNRIATSCTAVIGAVLILTVDNTRNGIMTFLAVTAAESALFSIIYGFKGSWRQSDGARAVFWVVLAYCGMSSHTLTLFIWRLRSPSWWVNDIRELLYLGLAVAGLNLVVTMIRVLGD